jgi:hypothetical protein
MACLAFSYVLKTWQKIRFIFIPKPERSSYELAKSFKEFALGVFLDVERVFDNTFFDLTDDAASEHGVCSTINK